MSSKEYRLEKGYELVTENYASEKEAYVIGDMHLNHHNIVKYCDRPFDHVVEMNNVLIKNWNLTVRKTDTVFFLGDMAMGNSDRIIRSLNGKILFVKGNHDRTNEPGTMHELLNAKYKGEDFQFIHNPDRLNGNKFDGWTIHGHHHNNHPDTYPFFSRENRRFNVSVENIKYQPLSMSKIIDIISSDIEWIGRLG
jgi:calcineurin-like phosphoesterase family protein